MEVKDFLNVIGFFPKENTTDIFSKKYADGYVIEINLSDQVIYYGKKIKAENKTTQNFSQPENWVVLECVNRLLETGYQPENITLEPTWKLGHQEKGRLDILVKKGGKAYLMVECKTYGKEYEKELKNLHKDGGQLFSYLQQDKNTEILMLYASQLRGRQIIFQNEIIKIEEEYRAAATVKDLFEKWNKLTKNNGIWENPPYDFKPKALTAEKLVDIKHEDSSFIFNRFLEILRHNVVSDKPNAFNKIFTLFLCKVYDEKSTKPGEELKFQWLEGIDNDVSFQIRLTDLYKAGMKEFLEKEVTDFSEDEFEREYKFLEESIKNKLLYRINKIRLEKNNEFAIKEVYDEKSFKENAKIVKEVVELLQGYKIRYNKRQQYLSDFFELLLTTGLKQESGQFFTPVPIAQFVIKSLPINKLVNEKLEKGERNNLLPFIIDYAAGSGHFLTESMHEVQALINKKTPKGYIQDTAKKLTNWQSDHFDWATQYVYGIEKDYRLVKVGKVGCYLHGDGLANVILSDGLANFKNKEYKGILKQTDADFPKENKQFDVLISNPPYSVSAFKIPARDYYSENDFELYNALTDNSSEIETLFIERAKQLLKDGGVAGVILPSSILSNTGIYAKAREIILQYFEIIGIAELGSNTFMATGTNTVTLFLRRRNNYDSTNLKIAVEKFFTHFNDVTISGIEKPVSKYVTHVWDGLVYDDYISLLKKEPNTNAANHEIYKEYRKKIKAKNDADFWKHVAEREQEKLFYFILAYPQNVVLIKSGQKDEEKRFLGYEFSNRRGSEGIHPIQRGKTIAECTQLFDEEDFENPEKASTYIYKAFEGDFDFEVHESLQQNISRHQLVDMLTFDRVEFEKTISTSVKKKVKIESKWQENRLDELAELQNGLWKGEKGDLKNVKVLRNTNFKLNNGKLLFDDVAEIDVEVKQLENRTLEFGDIILEKSGGSETQAIGRVALFDKKDKDVYSYSNFCSRIRVINKRLVNPIYLWLILNDFYNKGGTVPLQNGVRLLNIDLEGYKKIKIPLPPLEIQQKIVSDIEILEQKENEAKEEVEILKVNIIEKANNQFHKFPLSKLGLISQTPIYGANESAIDGNPKKDYRYIRITDINNDGSLNSNWKTAKNIEKKYILQDGDFLFARSGATAGKTFLYKEKYGKALYAGYLIKFPLKKELLNSLYLNFILKGDKYQTWVLEKRVGTAQPNINAQQFASFEIPLPPLSEQQKIVSQIEKIEEKISELETQISLIPKQKEAVLKKYL